MQFIQLIALLIVSLTVNGETPLPQCPVDCISPSKYENKCYRSVCDGKKVDEYCYKPCPHNYIDEGLLCRKKSSIKTYAKHRGHETVEEMICIPVMTNVNDLVNRLQ